MFVTVKGMHFIQKHIALSSLVAGFVLTLLSLFIVNVSSIKIDIMAVDVLKIQNERPVEDYICNGVIDTAPKDENKGFLFIITHKISFNEGCSREYIESHELYPLSFFVNWLIYSALVGAGLYGFKKVKGQS